MEFSKSQKAVRETWTGLRMNTAEWHQRSRSRDLIAKLKNKYTFLLFCVWISEYVNIYRNCLKRYLTCGIKKKKVVLRCKKKKRLFLRKLTKMYKLILWRRGDFFIWELKKVACLKQCPLYGFRFKDTWKGRILKTNEIKCVSPSQQRLCFRAWTV